ncbi:MAG: transcriptional repressor [Deltaproteobacteria bacterium]|nr:transcriptional repressor [Deltaproteobacteria bacterium]
MTIRPLTTQRRLLLRTMQEAGGHIDAKELYRRASEKDESISLATVYRNLRLFEEEGIIEERKLNQGCCCYELKSSGEHQHLVCRGCGKIMEFKSLLVDKLVKEVERKNKFSVSKVEVCIEGYCLKCKEHKS